jgi:hypothetical protein
MTGDWQLPEGQTIPETPIVPVRRLEDEQSVLLTGRKSRARVSHAGTNELQLEGVPILTDLSVDSSTQMVTENPVYLERTLTGGLRERLFLPLHHAAAVWEWKSANRNALTVRWKTLPPEAEPVQNGRTLRVGNSIFAFDHDVEWAFEAASVHASRDLGVNDSLMLAIATHEEAAMRALDNIQALVLSRQSDWSRASEELLRIECSDQQLADELNAAIYRLHAADVPLDSPDSPVARFLEDTLRFAPDPEKQRAVLAPRLPAEWSTFEVSNLRVGDDTMTLQFDRSGGTHTFVLKPLTGATPLRIVFEPALAAPGSSVTAQVDGVQADLNVRREGDRLVCPLQVVLDHARTVVIDTGS